MTPKPQPTNSDIYKQNADILRKFDSMDGRLKNLETWKIAEDSAKAAVAAYRLDERSLIKNRQFSQLIKDLLPLLVALTVLAYAVASRVGR